MNRRKCWLAEEPTQIAYRDLVGFVAAKSGRASLVFHKPANERCLSFLESIKQHLIEIKEQNEWPGTQLLSSTIPVYHYSLAPGFVAAIQQGVQGLYEWISPDRPEDLAFYREDASVALGSVAHERFAFVEMSDVELREFKGALPGIRFEGE